MRIFAIETSCDDTSIAIVDDGRYVRAMETVSQIVEHNKTGGVVPEVASREHIRVIMPTIQKILHDTDSVIEDIDAIAVTVGPGLIGSLLVGVETAKALAYAWGKPLYPVNHIYGHLASLWLDREEDIEYPLVVLTASGGHNELYLIEQIAQKKVIQKIGQTLDDAAGEAFDKVARMLGLPYPGGPHIEQVAHNGCIGKVSLPIPYKNQTLNFSFSGLKTAVKYLIASHDYLTLELQADICAQFQHVVFQSLLEKLHMAGHQYHAKALAIVGGVSANQTFRTLLDQMAQAYKYPCYFPLQKKYSIDNAAMIAATVENFPDLTPQTQDIFSVTAQASFQYTQKH